MDFPWKGVAAASAVSSYIATSTLRTQWSAPTFAKYYVYSYMLGFFSWALWTVLLYPKIFSPLRHLPGPKNLSWYNGQWSKIRALPSGVPMLEWYDQRPRMLLRMGGRC